jgi:hypothetical protein
MRHVAGFITMSFILAVGTAPVLAQKSHGNGPMNKPQTQAHPAGKPADSPKTQAQHPTAPKASTPHASAPKTNGGNPHTTPTTTTSPAATTVTTTPAATPTTVTATTLTTTKVGPVRRSRACVAQPEYSVCGSQGKDDGHHARDRSGNDHVDDSDVAWPGDSVAQDHQHDNGDVIDGSNPGAQGRIRSRRGFARRKR